MGTIDNLLEALRGLHCDNAVQAHYARHHSRQPHSTMPATSFVYEFFLFNSLYQYDWQRSFDEGRLCLWPPEDELSESAQQARFERFIRKRCKDRPSILRRAFDPISQLNDLDGDWTRITPDARIALEDGRRFFAKLAELAALVRSEDAVKPSKAVFDLISGCRHFVYLVRNNIFHGSKSIGEYYRPDQRRRLEIYDIFLKCLVSLFFLSVDREKVAADYVQLPIEIPFPDGSILTVGQSQVVDFIVSGGMKPEDSRLIRFCRKRQSAMAPQPDDRAALFYPSAGNDVLTPLMLGLPYCGQFFFYDTASTSRRSAVQCQVKRLLDVPIGNSKRDDEEILSFELAGVPRAIHLVKRDNMDFLKRDVDLALYFHRGDSQGEGGSGQAWDKLHIADLGEKTLTTRFCQLLTDGEPDGVHPELLKKLETIKIPNTQRGRDYYYGAVSGEFLRQLK